MDWSYRKKCLILITCATFLAGGCSSGNRMITNTSGSVEKIRLDPSDIPQTETPDGYYIGYGDILDVLFLYNTGYSREAVKVRPDGRISYPYIGEIDVAGRTIMQIDSLLTDKFSEILVDPDITVMVREFQPQQVYVYGEVGNPGGYPYSRGLTLMKALALGNGLKDSAKRNGVVVVRRVSFDHVVGIEVDVEDILDENRYDLDIAILPFDIIMVPKSKLATTSDFVSTMYNIIIKPADLYLKGWNIANVKILYDFYKVTGQTTR